MRLSAVLLFCLLASSAHGAPISAWEVQLWEWPNTATLTIDFGEDVGSLEIPDGTHRGGVMMPLVNLNPELESGALPAHVSAIVYNPPGLGYEYLSIDLDFPTLRASMTIHAPAGGLDHRSVLTGIKSVTQTVPEPGVALLLLLGLALVLRHAAVRLGCALTLLLIATPASATPILFEVGLGGAVPLNMTLDYDQDHGATIISSYYGEMGAGADLTGLEYPALPASVVGFKSVTYPAGGGLWTETYELHLDFVTMTGALYVTAHSDLIFVDPCCYRIGYQIDYVRPVPEPNLATMLLLPLLPLLAVALRPQKHEKRPA